MISKLIQLQNILLLSCLLLLTGCGGKYCFDFPDISEKQEFACMPKVSETYKVKISVKGKVSDSVELLLYQDEGIHGVFPIDSFKCSGGVVDTAVITGWVGHLELKGTIKPSRGATGHLKVKCAFIPEYF